MPAFWIFGAHPRPSMRRPTLLLVSLSMTMLAACPGLVPTEATNSPSDPVSYCSALSTSTFYCSTNVAMACSPNCMPNGWSGYCMIGQSRGNIGYSGVSSNGGAFPVTTFLEDMHNLCYPGNGVPNVCVSIARCERR